MKVNESTLTPINSTSDLQQMSQSTQNRVRRASASSTTQRQNVYIVNQRRQNLSALNNDLLTRSTQLSFTIPILMDTMNTFFQSIKTMEEEIMLPSKLKDMPVEGKKINNRNILFYFIFFLLELVFDSGVQPDNWHEIYTFIRDMRNQLHCTHPFSEDYDNDKTSNEKQRKYSDDEGIILSNHENSHFSSASSTVSSDEFERSSTSSVAASYDTIKDQLKYHYYGLFQTLDTLTSIANRVTEKYREESIF